jgi:iron-sulfur cluster repair protein YtfE (RIC family)
MSTIAEFLAAEHRGCDQVFSIAEDAAHSGDLSRCRADFREFCKVMEQHFLREEEVLFPAFEQASGNAMGPTRVMRLEHRQMRETLADMDGALADGNLENFMGLADGLLILVQQHNIKEEQMLYPMCDRLLGAAAGSVIEAMQYRPTDGSR